MTKYKVTDTRHGSIFHVSSENYSDEEQDGKLVRVFFDVWKDGEDVRRWIKAVVVLKNSIIEKEKS